MSTIAISTSSFGTLSAEPLERLRAAGFEPRMNPHGRKLTSEEARAHFEGVAGAVAGTEKLTRDVLAALPELKVISRVGVGVDGIDQEAASELGIAVRNTPEAHVDAVAELTLAGVLSALRRVPEGDRRVRSGWKKPMGRLLRGSTVGIVGLGRVGKALAALLQPFEADILAYDPVPDRAFAEERGIRFGELGELLADSDIVCLHLPYGPKAHHIVGAAELASMKKDAVLVNTSRGGLVDEAALADHLRENTGALAYLDTFEEEPYSGPLAELDNVVLTPHIGTYARECRVRMELEAVDNLLAVLRP